MSVLCMFDPKSNALHLVRITSLESPFAIEEEIVLISAATRFEGRIRCGWEGVSKSDACTVIGMNGERKRKRMMIFFMMHSPSIRYCLRDIKKGLKAKVKG